MSRKLRGLSAALVAVFALAAVIASAAQAKFDTFKTTPEATAVLTAEADGVQTLTVDGSVYQCLKISIAEATVETKKTEITVTPTWSECKIAGIAVNVASNECHFTLTGATTAVEPTPTVESATLHIVCPGATKFIKVGPLLGCELKIPEQTVHGLRYNNLATTEERTEHITLEAKIHKLKMESSGCASLLGTPNGSYEAATYEGNVTVLGFKDDPTTKKEGPTTRNGIGYETLNTETMP